MCQRRIPSAQWHQPRKCCREHWKWQWLHSTKNWFLPLRDTESSYLKIAFQSSSRNLVELVFLNMPTDIQARWMGMVLYGPQELLNSLWPRQPLSKSSCRFLHVPWREIIRAKSPGQKISKFVRNIEKERIGLSRSCNHFEDLNIESFLWTIKILALHISEKALQSLSSCIGIWGYFRAYLPSFAMSHLYYEGHCLDLWHPYATLRPPQAVC